MKLPHKPALTYSSAIVCTGEECGEAETSGSPFGIRGMALAGALGLALTSCQPSLLTSQAIMVNGVIYGPAPMPMTRTLPAFARADIKQQSIAAALGRNAISNSIVKSKISRGQARRVAVIVPSMNESPGGIMKVNPTTGAPEDKIVYKPVTPGGLQTGDIIKLGGTLCVVYVGRLSGT